MNATPELIRAALTARRAASALETALSLNAERLRDENRKLRDENMALRTKYFELVEHLDRINRDAGAEFLALSLDNAPRIP